MYVMPHTLDAQMSAGCNFLELTGDTSVCLGQTAVFTLIGADTVTNGSNPNYVNVYTSQGVFTILANDTMVIPYLWTTGTHDTLIVSTMSQGYSCQDTLFITLHEPPTVGIEVLGNMGCKVVIPNLHEPKPKVDTCYSVCDSTPTLYTAVYDTTHTYTFSWASTSGGAIITPVNAQGDSVMVMWTQISNAQMGNLLVYMTDSLTGCVGIAEMCINVIPRPNANIYIPPFGMGMDSIHICKGQTISVIDSSLDMNITSIVWNFGDGTVSTYAYPDPHTYTQAGIYTLSLVLTNACGCQDSAEVVVVVDSMAGAPIYCPTSVCAYQNDTYWTDTVGCYNFSWSSVNGTPVGSTTLDSVTIAWGSGVNGPGIVILDDSCSAGCPFPSFAVVPIVPADADISGSSSICPYNVGSTLLWTYSVPNAAGTVYNWAWSPPNMFNLIGANGYNQIHFTIGSAQMGVNGYLTVDYWNDFLGCGGRDTLPISITQTMSIEGPGYICQGATALYSVLPSNVGGPFSWTIDDYPYGNPISAGVSPTLTYAFPQAGQYQVIAYDVTGYFCNTPQTYTVMVTPPPLPVGITDPIGCACDNQTYTYFANVPVNAGQIPLIQWVAYGTTNAGGVQNGLGNSIMVNWAAGVPHILSVSQVVNGCASVWTNDTIPACSQLPDNISGLDTVCINTSSTYIATLPPGATNITWSVSPNGIGSPSAANAGATTANIDWLSLTTPINATIIVN
jgi:PKD repeat protein